MTDKEKQSAHEAQEATPTGFEQMAMFDPIPPEQEAAETLASITAMLQEVEAIRESPDYKATDLLMKLEEITLLAERCSSPRAIKIVCLSAAKDAEALYISTGNPAFDRIAERLTAVATLALTAQNTEEHPVIHIELPPVDPKLDPNSPDFDYDLWLEKVHEMGDFEGITEKLAEAAAGIADSMREALTSVATFLQSEAFAAIKESVRSIGEMIVTHGAEIAAAESAVADTAESIKPLIPFLQAELEEMKNDPQFAECTLEDIITGGFDENGNPIASPFEQAIERAKKRKAEFDRAQYLTTTAAAIEAELPLLKSIVPTKHTMPNNALMNALQKKPAINYGEWDLTIANPKGKRKEITALAKVSYDAAATGIELTGANMTEYERQVSDGIITLWLYGDESHIMTTDMIYRAMTGQGGEGKAPQGQKGAITKFMKKWEGVRITVDATEEMRKRGVTDKNGKPIKQFVFDEYYLNTRRVQVRAGGETVTAWQIISKPVILTYCEMTNQLLTVPAKMLDIKEVTTGGKTSAISLSNNADRIAIKGNLLRSIQIMKGKKRNKQEWSNIIAFDTLFAEIGLEDATRNRKKEMRNYAFSCFDYWKAEGFIAGYQVRTKGKAITGVEINL